MVYFKLHPNYAAFANYGLKVYTRGEVPFILTYTQVNHPAIQAAIANKIIHAIPYEEFLALKDRLYSNRTSRKIAYTIDDTVGYVGEVEAFLTDWPPSYEVPSIPSDTRYLITANAQGDLYGLDHHLLHYRGDNFWEIIKLNQPTQVYIRTIDRTVDTGFSGLLWVDAAGDERFDDTIYSPSLITFTMEDGDIMADGLDKAYYYIDSDGNLIQNFP